MSTLDCNPFVQLKHGGIILFCNVYVVQVASLLEVTRVHSKPEAGVYLVVGISLVVLFDTASIVLAALRHQPHVRIP